MVGVKVTDLTPRTGSTVVETDKLYIVSCLPASFNINMSEFTYALRCNNWSSNNFLKPSIDQGVYAYSAVNSCSGDWILNNGNSFSGPMTIGTINNCCIVLKTNDTPRAVINNNGLTVANGISGNGGPHYFGGNVGICTSTPNEALTIKGNISACNTVYGKSLSFAGSQTTSSNFYFDGLDLRFWNTSRGSTCQNRALAVNPDSNYPDQLAINYGGDFQGGVAIIGNTRITGGLSATGSGSSYNYFNDRVGIGTNNPNQKLTVVGSVCACDWIYGDNGFCANSPLSSNTAGHCCVASTVITPGIIQLNRNNYTPSGSALLTPYIDFQQLWSDYDVRFRSCSFDTTNKKTLSASSGAIMQFGGVTNKSACACVCFIPQNNNLSANKIDIKTSGKMYSDSTSSTDLDTTLVTKDFLNIVSPVGAVVAYAAATAPTGWLVANGSSISRTTYAALFAIIGTTFGSDSASTFKLPDLRGQFIRGYDNGRGLDSGRVFGSCQNYAIENITGHFGADDRMFNGGVTGPFYQGISTSTGSTGTESGYFMEFDASRAVNTSSETRPVNLALIYIIKY